jgi:predicted transposase/invertase (TIGR01784 family)
LRELYSAIEGVTLPPDIPIDINTLSNILFMEKINDISFLLDNRIVVLIEHQSSINNNIPFRLLEYIVRIYEKIIDQEKKYNEKLINIPKPEFIILYNGTDEYPDYKELKLSSAFMDIEGLKLTGIDKIPLELIVQVYNINRGHNPEILKKSRTLDGYSIFIDKIREYMEKEKTLEKALPSAVKYCISNDILKDFLREHGSEVINMFYGEYDREMDIAVKKREAWEDGHEEGLEEGKLIIAKNLLAKGSTPEFVHDITGISLEKIKELNSEIR